MAVTDPVLLAIGVAYLLGLLVALAAMLVAARTPHRREPRAPGSTTRTTFTFYGPSCDDIVTAALADQTPLPVVAGPGQGAPPDDVPPLVVEGPPSGHGSQPSGLPVVRIPSCSRCLDEGFVGGCRWCAAEPRMVRPFTPARHANGGRR